MQSKQKYLRISTWPRLNTIHNLPLIMRRIRKIAYLLSKKKKNGSFMVKFIAKDNGLTRMNLSNLPDKWSFMEEKFCRVYGEITMISFILSF